MADDSYKPLSIESIREIWDDHQNGRCDKDECGSGCYMAQMLLKAHEATEYEGTPRSGYGEALCEVRREVFADES